MEINLNEQQVNFLKEALQYYAEENLSKTNSAIIREITKKLYAGN